MNNKNRNSNIHKTKLKHLQWNARSLPNKMQTLIDLVEKEKYDIISITEFNFPHDRNAFLPGYRCVSKDLHPYRKNHVSAVAIFARSGLNTELITSPVPNKDKRRGEERLIVALRLTIEDIFQCCCFCFNYSSSYDPLLLILIIFELCEHWVGAIVETG